MGLRDYEFDVAPELVAAVVRGRPGPLMDAALAHIGNISEAAREAEQGAQNARDRAMVEGVEQSVAASVQNVDTIVGNGVNQGGAFSVGRVGGSVGDVNRMGSDLVDPTSGLGPGRNVGWIPGSKGDFGVKGVGVQDFIQGQILGGPGSRSQGPTQPVSSQLLPRTPEEQALYDSVLEAEYDRDTASTTENRATWIRKAALRYSEYLRFRGTKVTPNPDGESGPSLDTAVDAYFLLQWLKSLGGLGFRSDQRIGSKLSRRPNIFNAVDPAPDSESSHGGTEFYHWSFELIDPTPDGW